MRQKYGLLGFVKLTVQFLLLSHSQTRMFCLCCLQPQSLSLRARGANLVTSDLPIREYEYQGG